MKNKSLFMMNTFICIVWTGSFVGLFFGYKPSVISVGCGFVVAALESLALAIKYQ